MKNIFITATFLLSFSGFATEADSELFTSKSSTKSDYILLSGCRQAKNDAIESAKEMCFQKGYAECLLKEAKKIESSKAGIYLATEEVNGLLSTRFVYKSGHCTFEAHVRGIN
ncbi:MAG: hypothetical protein KBD76_01060 [Bacteriovorax sp.]|nr:hypothetical protein [Bacteriovorax sp.]